MGHADEQTGCDARVRCEPHAGVCRRNYGNDIEPGGCAAGAQVKDGDGGWRGKVRWEEGCWEQTEPESAGGGVLTWCSSLWLEQGVQSLHSRSETGDVSRSRSREGFVLRALGSHGRTLSSAEVWSKLHVRTTHCLPSTSELELKVPLRALPCA